MSRRRLKLGVTDEACSLCGHRGLDLVESARVARGLARVRFWEGRRRRRYKLCPACGARQSVPVGGRHTA